VSRARESSFSLDSDEDYYYSSPEDEEEFVNKEFIKDYNMVRTDRLVDMTK
jgi:protein HEXIM1/2